MGEAQKNAVESYRQRQRRRGLRRLEVQAPEADAALLRDLARVLREDAQKAPGVRRVLRRVLGEDAPEASLKKLLEAAPLEGIDLSRLRDFDREVGL